MPSPDVIRRVTAIGLFLLPVGLVKLAGLYLGQAGPGTVLAAEADASTPQTNVAPIKAPIWTARQTDAGKYVAALRSRTFAPTPFLYEAREPEPQTASATTTSVTTGPTSVDASKFIVQGISSSSLGTTALIDGKPYRVGDTIRESSWVIQSIVAENRSVTLRDRVHDRILTIQVAVPDIAKSQGE